MSQRTGDTGASKKVETRWICSPHQIVPRIKVMDDVEGGLETKGLPVKLPPGGPPYSIVRRHSPLRRHSLLRRHLLLHRNSPLHRQSFLHPNKKILFRTHDAYSKPQHNNNNNEQQRTTATNPLLLCLSFLKSFKDFQKAPWHLVIHSGLCTNVRK
jgi:hypothetical protein